MQEPVLKIHILCAGMYGSSVVPAYFSNAVFADSVIDQRFSFGWNNVGYSVMAAIAKEEDETVGNRVDGQVIAGKSAQTDALSVHPFRNFTQMLIRMLGKAKKN